MTERLKPGPVPRYPEEKRLSVSLVWECWLSLGPVEEQTCSYRRVI